MLTQVGVKQLTDFLRTVTAASDLVDCSLVNCGFVSDQVGNQNVGFLMTRLIYKFHVKGYQMSML